MSNTQTQIKTGIKLKCTNIEQSAKIQEICFANGIYWGDRDTEIKDYNLLFIDKDYNGTFLYKVNDNATEFFNQDTNELIDPELFIRTNGTCIEELSTPESNTKEQEPQTESSNNVKLSDFLKENNAYDSFMGQFYFNFYSEAKYISLSNFKSWEQTPEGEDYWNTLYGKWVEIIMNGSPEYDITKEDIIKYQEQNNPTKIDPADVVPIKPQPKKYLVYVQGKSNPKKVHDSLESAETEAKRLSAKEIGSEVYVVEIVKSYKSKVTVEEIK